MTHKIFLVACEASGDLHGAHLIEEIRKLAPDTVFCGVGGAKMRAAGMQIFHDMTKISALGLGDVLRNYFKYLKIFNEDNDYLSMWPEEQKNRLINVIDYTEENTNGA